MIADQITPREKRTDYRDPLGRLSRLLDAKSLMPVHEDDNVGTHVVHGSINGSKVLAYCTDPRNIGGAMSAAGCRRVVEAIDAAVCENEPVLGIWHSGGAKLTEGVASLDGVGSVFAAMVRASGRVPQISVVLGPAAGGAAYGPALTDLVIMSDEGRVFVTGPTVVRAVTGEQIDMEGLGGPDTHNRRSGVAHVVAHSEAEALSKARQITGFFTEPGLLDTHALLNQNNLRVLLPETTRRAYDVRPLVRSILDDETSGGGFQELQPGWAPNIVIGLGRLGGSRVGVIANNPIRKAGCLDSLSAEKAARFVRMCDSFGIPLVVLVDVPGYLPGIAQEWDGVVRRGAKLLYAFAESTVPRVTLITRKAYGGAYIAMNSRALGATAVFAWPDAEIAVMGAEAAVDILHRKRLAATDSGDREQLRCSLAAAQRLTGDVGRAVELGVVDDVIEPACTRRRLAEAIASAPALRGGHGNIPL